MDEDCQDQREIKVTLDHLESLEKLDNRDQLVSEGPKDLEEKKAKREILDFLDHLGDLENLDIQVPLEIQDHREQTEFQE